MKILTAVLYVLMTAAVFSVTNCLFSGHGHDHSKHGTTPIGIPPDYTKPPPVTKMELELRGQTIYVQTCAQCHQADALGVVGSVPPLAESDYLMADRRRSIETLVKGLSGEIIVNGSKYNGQMPPIMGSNNDLAAVLTYVRNQFNRAVDSISVAEVAAVRGSIEFPLSVDNP